MKDLTIIYLTLNNLPDKWMEYQQKVLLEAIGDTQIISISRIPMNLGINLIQTEKVCSSNVYWQLLRAAKLATTEFIAVAEDDSLYNTEHYSFRPQKDEFAYNNSHWSLFTWGEPTYSWRNRKGNYTLVAPRLLVIESLEERFTKYPNGTPEGKTGELGRSRTDRMLGLTQHKVVEFSTTCPVINICHDNGLDDRARRHKKSFGTLRAYDIPYWGKAKELIKNYNNL